MTQRLPAWLVLAGAAAYVAVVGAAGLLTPGYDATRQLISELGQVGAPHATLMRGMLLAVGVAVLLLARVLPRGGILVALIGVGLFLGGVFPCDETCAPRTFAGWAHILTSVPATLASLIAPFVVARALTPGAARVSRGFGWAALAALLGAMFLFPAFGVNGVGQRIATAIPLAWMAFLAVVFLRAPRAAFPPGPSGLQALRYLGRKRNLIEFAERCRADFGGLAGIRLLGIRACLVSDPALIDTVFVQHASRLAKWDAGQFALLLGKGLLTSHGELWRRQRSLIQPVFSAARLEDHTARIVAEAERMLAAWPAEGTVDVHSELMRASLKIAAGALFGADVTAVERLIEDTQNLLMTQFEQALSGLPVPMWVPTPLNLRTRRAIRRLDEAIRGLIAERRQRDTGARDFLGALLAARDEAGTGMTDQQLRDECVTMILAGHETTAVTLTWTLHCLSQHPQYAEDTSDGALRRVLDEAMRVYPPVWAIGRVTTEAFELGGSHLPAGTQLFLLPYLTHRDGETWASPLEFRPERWETDAKPPKGSFLPFGAGPRKCVGMHFAVHELTLLLRAVISRYRLAPSGEPVELQPSVTLRPRHGLKLRIERRPVDSTRRDPVS